MAAVRSLPWKRILAIAKVILDRLGEDIPQKDRQRLTRLLRKSKGDYRNLTASERHEVFAIIRKVDLARMGRDVAGVAATAKLLKR